MDVDDLLHRVGIRKLDVVEEAAAQESVGQFLLIVRCDDDHRTLDSTDRFAGLVDMLGIVEGEIADLEPIGP